MGPEAKVEHYLYEQCKKRGWLCEKFVSPGRRSVPDRLITIPNLMVLAEIKSSNGRLTALQERDHARRKALGISVVVLRTKMMVDIFINALEAIEGGRQ